MTPTNPTRERRDSLGRIRRAEQDDFKLARAGHTSRSHNINMTPTAHEAFAALTAIERGDLITRAMRTPRP